MSQNHGNRRVNTTEIGQFSRSISLILALSCMAACSDTLRGTYSDKQGVTTYEFDGNGRTNISVSGSNIVAEYIVDENRVLVTGPQGTIVLTRAGDRLVGPMGMELFLQTAQRTAGR